MSGTPSGDGWAAKLLRSLAFDAGVALRHAVINKVAGSAYLPRVARFALYKAVGLDIRTPNVAWGCTFTSRDVHIGEGTFVNWGCSFVSSGITIGRNCQIGMQTLFTTAHHPAGEDGRPSMDVVDLPIVLGDGCWLATRVTVLPGVTIAPGVTVAAGAVVASDLPSPGLYGGVPARRIRPA